MSLGSTRRIFRRLLKKPEHRLRSVPLLSVSCWKVAQASTCASANRPTKTPFQQLTRAVLPALLAMALAGRAPAQDLPAAITAETQKLVFHVAAAASLREGLRSTQQQARGAKIVKLRAFVAAESDSGSAAGMVREAFQKQGRPLPALSVIRVGALPRAAQAVWESVAEGKKAVNPHGLAFISGQAASSEKPSTQMVPLLEKSLADLRSAVKAADVENRDVLRATCFMTSLGDISLVRRLVEAEYPQAALNYVQLQRSPVRSVVECEAVARLRVSPGGSLQFIHPESLPRSPNYSQVAAVGAPRLAFTGAHLAMGLGEAEARLAFKKLEHSLELAGASIRQVAMSTLYPVFPAAADLVRKIRFEFYDPAHPPASTLLLFDGLPEKDASFGVDVVAVAGSAAALDPRLRQW